MNACLHPSPPGGELRRALDASHRREEKAAVADLVAEWQAVALPTPAVTELARRLVRAVREERRSSTGVDHLMREFSLSTREGVALMCLAEALLRIPDAATADRLIKDKISKGDWQSHLGHSGSLFVNAASWGLMLTGRLVAADSHSLLGGALTQLLARGGEPIVRRGVDFAMRLLGQQFVMGQTIGAALSRSAANEARGYRHSFDMLGEAALTQAEAVRYFRAYESAILAIGRASAGRGVYAGPGISIKLSALHPRYGRAQKERVMAELLPRLKSLALLARQFDLGLNIDAEESERLDLSLDLFTALVRDPDPDLAGWQGLGFVIQAYQKRAPALVAHVIDLARASGRRLMVRLVKGAYWDSEIKKAQVEGLCDYPVFTRKAHTDLCYLVCAHRLLAAHDAVFGQFATHNAHTVAAVHELARRLKVEDYEFQCLHGMGEGLYDNVVGPARLNKPCRIYAPVGSHATLLPYLVRRLLENGANSSFVNRLVDETVSVDELVADPLRQVLAEGGGPHPRIPLPGELFSDRRNSTGVDLASEPTIADLEKELAALAEKSWAAVPLVPGKADWANAPRPVLNPADRGDQVGMVVEAGAAEASAALAVAAAFAPEWLARPPAERAALLERSAALLEAHRVELMSLLIREAGKTWANAIAEVREAADFCRYYARQLRDMVQSGVGAGPLVCISPWNFPLAIFTGQVAAALAAGSPVLAKPAEQTPLTAYLAVQLFHKAGIPPAALQLLPGPGESLGAALVADSRVGGVIFTGSTAVARHINKSLSRRPGPEPRLIAETGGQNAMIVDSTALPEQVVQDVLASGFDSAGQRCSALRILCLQEDIAPSVLEFLKGALAERLVGDPARLATDIGPVIDGDAQAALEAHVRTMAAAGRRVFRQPLAPACGEGSFVPPTLIEIASIRELPGEVFGPVVHVLPFAAADLNRVVEAVNGTGYGLTFGLHTRIDDTIEAVTSRVRAGNIYVNRNMVGAVVGVQPFGGEGLSGTGPKAGGPLYLHRLAGSEQVPPAAIGASRMAGEVPGQGAFRALSTWARAEGLGDLARACGQYAALSLLPCRLELPGPTGERNTLTFAPRGKVLCVADREEEFLLQVAAALAAGNQARLAEGPAARAVMARLPEGVKPWLQVVSRDTGDTLGAALHAGSPAGLSALRADLAERDGPLVPVLTPGKNTGLYSLYRLLVERVVTVNTTAAGGNTTLMTLRD